MNIIFGDNRKLIPDRFIVLELDTFYVKDADQRVPTYCVVDKVPLQELPLAEKWKDLHQSVIVEFRKQNWAFCQQAIADLRGHWAGELDTFYDELDRRIEQFKQEPPPADWDGCLVR
jgi:hypothetical protein